MLLLLRRMRIVKMKNRNNMLAQSIGKRSYYDEKVNVDQDKQSKITFKSHPDHRLGHVVSTR